MTNGMTIDPSLLERAAVIREWERQNYSSVVEPELRRRLLMLQETACMALRDVPCNLDAEAAVALPFKGDERYAPLSWAFCDFMGVLGIVHYLPVARPTVQMVVRTIASLEAPAKRVSTYEELAAHRHYAEYFAEA